VTPISGQLVFLTMEHVAYNIVSVRMRSGRRCDFGLTVCTMKLDKVKPDCLAPLNGLSVGLLERLDVLLGDLQWLGVCLVVVRKSRRRGD
jgi:hypothetical protein